MYKEQLTIFTFSEWKTKWNDIFRYVLLVSVRRWKSKLRFDGLRELFFINGRNNFYLHHILVGFDEKLDQLIASLIVYNNGVVVAEQLAPFLRDPPGSCFPPLLPYLPTYPT